jgi:hypothetical protein
VDSPLAVESGLGIVYRVVFGRRRHNCEFGMSVSSMTTTLAMMSASTTDGNQEMVRVPVDRDHGFSVERGHPIRGQSGMPDGVTIRIDGGFQPKIASSFLSKGRDCRCAN